MESTILKFITSLQVGDIKISSESCWIIRCGREDVRDNNRRSWTDQSKVYSQMGHMKKPLEPWHWNWKWKTGL
jgi:hypothetical protein